MSDRVIKLREDSFEAEMAKHATLMRRWAARICGRWWQADVDECISIGWQAAWVAWQHYQESWGVKFLSYAQRGITRKMTEYLTTLTTIRVPRQKTFQDWRSKLVLCGSLEESFAIWQAEEGDFDASRMALLTYGEPVQSAVLDVRDDVDAVAGALETLSPKQRQIIELVYFKGLGMREVAGQLGVTRQAIEQQHAKALQRLRAAMRSGDNRALSVRVMRAAKGRKAA